MLGINLLMISTYLNQLQTKIIQYEIVVTFLTGYKGIFIVRGKHFKLKLATSITDKDGFVNIIIPWGGYEDDSL